MDAIRLVNMLNQLQQDIVIYELLHIRRLELRNCELLAVVFDW